MRSARLRRRRRRRRQKGGGLAVIFRVACPVCGSTSGTRINRPPSWFFFEQRVSFIIISAFLMCS